MEEGVRACVQEARGCTAASLAAAAVSDRGRLRQSLLEFGRERPKRRREEDQGLTGVLSEALAGHDGDGDDGATTTFRTTVAGKSSSSRFSCSRGSP